MALLLFTSPPHSSSSSSSFFSSPIPTKQPFPFLSSLSFPSITTPTRALRLRSLRRHSSLSDDEPSGDDPPKVTDEWGEKSDPEPESSYTKLSASDPPKDEDEWGKDDRYAGGIGNGRGDSEVGDGETETETETKEDLVKEKLLELKRCLVDSIYGTELGFRARLEERAEILELVNQLEALNPTPAPTQALELLGGNWVLLYTGFSELLPLLAAGSTPLLKVDKICQSIDTSNLTIVNSTTLSSPVSTFSFSATATFEVRSPFRIQVQFKEGTFQAPEIKSSVDLPREVDIFGQKISLSPLQQTLNPIQEAAANISRAISGQPPLRLPIPGERTQSWLLITYLDEDFRISRGDGGLFVLAKEGSPLLYQ
ncbi:putative plastid-lipid-associated protein 3 [Morus notabilis]|uniref:Putative plastid-lipid-associated protein 3 n=1 Tax=Morus notabilis TaxID=981085 RepID=W9R350_9ROSA|nr:plastoglobulin-1, chloroplastic [Morus notabilis]EXB66511.1 putative plastid-lipid-associated protein 3 [Morus notabilis]